MAKEEKPPAKGGDDDEELGEGGKAALIAERKTNRENRAKITALEEQVAELVGKKKEEDGQGGKDGGKLNDELAEVRAELAEERLTRLRLEVGSEKGLTPKQARRLSGKTREELEEDADDLLDTFPAPPAKDGEEGDEGTGGSSTSSKERRPAENLKGGGKAETEPEETDPRKLAESMPRV